MASLYELNGNYLQLLAMLESGDIDEETFNDTFESVEGDIENKARGYGIILGELEAKEARLKSEIERLSDKKKVVANNYNKLKDRLFQTMLLIEKDKIVTDLYTFTVRNNAPSLNVVDETLIPKKYFNKKTTETLDKKLVLSELKEGKKIKGVGVQVSRSLMIK